MRLKVKALILTLAVILSMAAFTITVSANTPTASPAAKTEEKKSVNDSSQSKSPLTPKGNLTAVDDVHQVTDTSKSTIQDKEFLTVESKNGNTFYIIIDRSGTTENVYFLNAVDESDLAALLEDEEKAQLTTKLHSTCNCTTKCEQGHINMDCPVCSKNADDCACSAAATAEPKKDTQKKQNSFMPLIALAGFALLGAGGAFYWYTAKNKKTSTKGDTDLDDLYDEDDDTEIESDDSEGIETETYETENEDESEEIEE